jgi:hypothetical protein
MMIQPLKKFPLTPMTFAHLSGNDWITFSKKADWFKSKILSDLFSDSLNILKRFLAEEVVLHPPEQMII